MKRLLILSLLLLVAIQCDRPAVKPLQSVEPAQADTTLGHEAPDFVLSALDGDSLQLSSLRGRVVVLNFWATWCVPCLHEMPALSRMHAALSPAGLTVLGVSMDTEGIDIVRHYANRLNVTYPILLGNGEIANNYDSVVALPMTYIIDEQGIIRRRFVGLFDVDALQTEMDAYLARKSG